MFAPFSYSASPHNHSFSWTIFTLVDIMVMTYPYSAAVDASSYTFQFYSGGVFYDDSCSTNKLNHALLVVGYSSYNGVPYWIVKNRYS